MSHSARKPISRKKQALFFALILGVCLVGASLLAEYYLRYQRREIGRSDQLEPGLMVYDSDLGWKLDPNWKGRHRHYDFDVTYTTTDAGFRSNADLKEESDRGRRYAVVGDSFTFGLGVNDDETFISYLNREWSPAHCFLNFGVPGFSTDQEMLLIRKQVLPSAPDVVLLVVYLGNDLFDNTLAFPLQANYAKPYFELDSGRLIARNQPVPLERKPQEQQGQDLAAFVWGGKEPPAHPWKRYFSRFELLKALDLRFSAPFDYQAHFDHRFEYPLQLFKALVGQIQAACTRRGVPLVMILMPGRSFILRPESPSAQMQDYLRRQIMAWDVGPQIGLIDLAAQLRDHTFSNKEIWFHPNEGHFTARGHQTIADLLGIRVKLRK